MSALTQVTEAEIKSLKDTELVELLDRLIHCELKMQKISDYSVDVPYNITTGDGGIDGLVTVNGDSQLPPFIPATLTAFQVKATPIGVPDCAKEILENPKDPKPKVKQRIREVIESGGAYVLFSNRTMKKKSERVDAIRDSLRMGGAKNTKKIKILLYDVTTIHQWTNRHFTAQLFVWECTNRSRPSDFSTWELLASKDEFNEFSYVENDFLHDLSEEIRKALAAPKAAVRLVGFTGTGKTRFVLEAFRPDSGDPKSTALCNSVGYVDGGSDNLNLMHFVGRVAQSGTSAIIVVDNCSFETHIQLVAQIKVSGSNVSLMTVDYETEEQRDRYQTPIFLLRPERLYDVVEKMLRNPPLSLEPDLAKHIADLAQGFPLIATLLGRDRHRPDFGNISEYDVFPRLLWGRNEENEKHLEVIQSLSLFKHIGMSGRRATQKAFLLKHLCARLSERNFNLAVQHFRKRGLVQNVGDYIVVRPLPLAMGLAAQWLDVVPDADLSTLLETLSAEEELLESFTSQIRHLSFSDKAREIVDRLYSSGSPFADAEVLTSRAGSGLFRAFSEVNPQAALRALERAISEKSIEDLRGLHAGRRNLVWALEKLCFDRNLFEDSVRLLFRLAAAENETYSNNATGVLKQLYHFALPGTEVPMSERLGVLREALDSEAPEVRRIAVEILGEALTMGTFTRSGGPEVLGSAPPRKDADPASWEEVFDYWKECFSLLETTAYGQDQQLAERARDVLGNRIRTIVASPLAEDLEERVRRLAEYFGGYWPTGLRAVRDEIFHALRTGKDERLLRLQQWEDWFSPSDLSQRIELLVTKAPVDFSEGKDGKFIDNAMERAKRLGQELAELGEKWWDLLPQVLRHSQQQAVTLGHELGKREKEPDEFSARCIEVLRSLAPDERNPDLLGALLATAARPALTKEILTIFAEDSDLAPLLPRLTSLVRPSIEDLRRVLGAIRAGRLPAHSFKIFAYASVIDEVEPDDLVAFLEAEVGNEPALAAATHEVIHMYCHRNEERWKKARKLIKRLLAIPGILNDKSGALDHYSWEHDVLRILKDRREKKFARAVGRQIFSLVLEGDFLQLRDNAQDVLAVLFKDFPTVVWRDFANSIADLDKPNKYRVVLALGSRLSYGRRKCPIWEVPEEDLHALVRSDRDLAVLMIHEISFFEGDDEKIVWTPGARALLEAALKVAKEKDVQSSLSANLFSFGSSGSRVPYLRRRVELLQELKNEAGAKLRRIADAIIAELNAEIEEEKRRDEEFRAGIF